ncbi:DUF3667 domain-containing protein [Lutimonas sp.]|uniref:DUF3667 domain-containing protein n=1 Tax=Lutimonas sp. TaxID=1872403 RepID=UPI003D9BFB87
MKSITRFTKNIRGNECLNCGTRISTEDNFCSKCGQVNDTHRLSVNQYFSEYLSGFFNFDNRFIKTVIPLIFKPGFVSKEYIEGKRIKYVNPFQLYLHITILFFLVLGIFNGIDKFRSIDETKSGLLPKINLDQGQQVLDSIKSETLRELNENNVDIDSSTLSLINSNIDNLSINKDSLKSQIKIQSKQQESALIGFIDSILLGSNSVYTFKSDYITLSEKDSTMSDIMLQISERAEFLTDNDETFNLTGAADFSKLWVEISKKENLEKKGIKHLDSIFLAEDIKYQIPLDLVYDLDKNQSGFNIVKAFMAYQKDYPNAPTKESLEKLGFEATYWNIFLFSKSKEWGNAFDDDQYWAEFLDRVLSRISVALFFLLPIFTLMVSLLYIRRKYNYTENLVFVFHVQTVFFLLLLIFMIVNRFAGSGIAIVIFFITFMIYLYKAMRNFYGQGWFKTLIKYILLNTAFMLLALVGGLIISFLAFLI